MGRVPLYEVLVINDALANTIADDQGRESFHRMALESGYTSMAEMAKMMVAAGTTTPEEILRVVGDGPVGTQV